MVVLTHKSQGEAGGGEGGQDEEEEGGGGRGRTFARLLKATVLFLKKLGRKKGKKEKTRAKKGKEKTRA